MKRNEAILEARGITKVYPNGIVANRGVNLSIKPGEVLALLGENGAGKTTLVRILAGELKPTSGTIVYEGREVRFSSPRDALKRGIALVPQHPRLFDGLTVSEDLGLTLKLAGLRAGMREVRSKIKRLSEQYGLSVDPEAKVWTLSMGERQRVELLRVLMLDAKVIMLDEPTTHMTPLEASSLVKLVRRLANEGRAVVFITHKLREALDAADRIAVMRRGEVTRVLPRSEASREKLIHLMFGETLPSMGSPAKGVADDGGSILFVENLWVRGAHGVWAVRGASLEVRSGEILGVAGVAGNGQRELFETLVGIRKPSKGRILLDSRDVTRRPPKDRISMGVAVIPEERLGWGLVPGKSIVFNVALAHAFTNGRLLIDWSQYTRLALEAIEALSVKTRGPHEPVDSLSGGNQQRLIVARELLRRPKLILAMNPTSGLDYRAAVLVRKALIESRQRGSGVLLISEDLDELTEISDRIVVMSRGRLLGPFKRPFNVREIAEAMTA